MAALEPEVRAAVALPKLVAILEALDRTPIEDCIVIISTALELVLERLPTDESRRTVFDAVRRMALKRS